MGNKTELLDLLKKLLIKFPHKKYPIRGKISNELYFNYMIDVNTLTVDQFINKYCK